MTINIDTDIDVNIKKVEELIKKLELLEDKSKMINFLTVEEFSKLRKCSISTRFANFSEKNPSRQKTIGKNLVVEIEALKQWYMTKRDKKECG